MDEFLYQRSELLVTMDLDRPRRGFIKVSEQSMLKLQNSIN